MGDKKKDTFDLEINPCGEITIHRFDPRKGLITRYGQVKKKPVNMTVVRIK